MRYSLALASTVLVMPVAALAAGASFASQSVFLSRSSVMEGDTVLVYASIVNPATGSFDGKVVFDDNGAEIGSVSVSLSPGDARVVSVSWQPQAGSHHVIATLQDGNGATVTKIAEQTLVVSVAPALPSTTSNTSSNINTFLDSSSTPVESALPIEQSISSLSPGAASATKPMFSAIDGARRTTASVLDNQLSQVKPKLPGAMPGAQKSGQKPQGVLGWLLAVWWTLYFYILTIARFVIGSFAIFYPLLAVMIVWLLFKLYKKISAPRYRY